MSLITATSLTAAADTTNVSSFTTASVSPTGGKLILLCVISAAAITPTITGGGMASWSLVKTQANVLATNILIDYGAAQTGCIWSVSELSNTASGNNGLTAIRQSVGSTLAVTATTLSVTLAAFTRAQNATFGVCHIGLNEAMTEGSGYTQLSENGMTAPVKTMSTEFKNSNDTNVGWSWTNTVSNANCIGLEIVASLFPKVATII